MLVYLKGRSAQTILRAATLRQKLHIKFSAASSHSKLTPGQPVPSLTPQRQAPDRMATGVPIFYVTGTTGPEKISTAKAEIEIRVCRSRGGHLNHSANEEVVAAAPEKNNAIKRCFSSNFALNFCQREGR